MLGVDEGGSAVWVGPVGRRGQYVGIQGVRECVGGEGGGVGVWYLDVSDSKGRPLWVYLWHSLHGAHACAHLKSDGSSVYNGPRALKSRRRRVATLTGEGGTAEWQWVSVGHRTRRGGHIHTGVSNPARCVPLSPYPRGNQWARARREDSTNIPRTADGRGPWRLRLLREVRLRIS